MKLLGKLAIMVYLECRCGNHVTFAPVQLNNDSRCSKCEELMTAEYKVSQATQKYLGFIVRFGCPTCKHRCNVYLDTSIGRVGCLHTFRSIVANLQCSHCKAAYNVAEVITDKKVSYHLVDNDSI